MILIPKQTQRPNISVVQVHRIFEFTETLLYNIMYEEHTDFNKPLRTTGELRSQ